ncbi:hypothetical protein HWV62_4669 [Athelia sp. TMB]|nr:hypothetical protein HWV62_4669 [Athelia sp. TMB]
METSFHLNEPPTKNDRIDEILAKVQKTSGTLGGFLYDIFHYVPRGQHPRNSDKQTSMVSAFLGGRSDVKADQIVEMMYEHPFSAPIKRRKKKDKDKSSDMPVVESTSSKKKGQDPKLMAKWGIKEWATRLMERVVDGEAKEMASVDGGLHLPSKDVKWDFVHGFSLGKAMSSVEEKAPTLLRLITAAAIPAKKRQHEGFVPASYAEHFSKPAPGGSGNNRRDPFVVSKIYSSIACLS